MKVIRFILVLFIALELSAQDATLYMTQTEELEFMQADWMDNYSTNNNISIASKWFGESIKKDILETF